MSNQKRDKLISAGLTFLITLVMLLVLVYGYISWDPALLASSSIPEIKPEEEEIFIEPKLVELGEQRSVVKSKPAPTLKGKPKQAPEERSEIVDPGPKETQTPKPVRNELTQKKESALEKEEAAKTEKEKQEATSAVANKFAPKNGSEEGSDEGTSGAGGTGVGVSGSAHGRTFISCPKPDVALRHKTVVRVNVVVDAEGKVIEATASGSASAEIRRKCEAAARQARWSAKKGAATTRGSITFTITPR